MLKHGYKLIYLEKASVLVEEEQKFNVGICGCKTQISVTTDFQNNQCIYTAGNGKTPN